MPSYCIRVGRRCKHEYADWEILHVLNRAVECVLLSSSVGLSEEAKVCESGSDTTLQQKAQSTRPEVSI